MYNNQSKLKVFQSEKLLKCEKCKQIEFFLSENSLTFSTQGLLFSLIKFGGVIKVYPLYSRGVKLQKEFLNDSIDLRPVSTF